MLSFPLRSSNLPVSTSSPPNDGFQFPFIKSEYSATEELPSTFQTTIQEPDFDSVQVTNDYKESADQVKLKVKSLYKALMDCATSDGRRLIFPFLENPSREFQPHYYEVIKKPMDMKTVKYKIAKSLYGSICDAKSDFLLMFSNAQEYHERDSQVFIDAQILKGVLFENWKHLVQQSLPPFENKKVTKGMKNLYKVARNFKDEDGKKLSSAFLKFPSKIHFPDYHKIIKQPTDFETIQHKLNIGHYSSIEGLFNELNLLYQNVCRYNEPQSQIYRDALTLQYVTIQEYLNTCTNDSIPIEVSDIVRNLIMSLFISTYNVQSSKGKYVTNSFTKLPIYEECEGQRRRMISLDVLKCRLDLGLYTRLDHFQNDFFSFLDKARTHTDLNSRLYSDTITLQKKYLILRDEVFRHGSLAILKTKALDFRESDLNKLLEQKVIEKTALDDGSEFDGFSANDCENKDIKVKKSIQLTYGVMNGLTSGKYSLQCLKGDFVYLVPERISEPYRICLVERIYTDDMGRRVIHGSQFLRSEETLYKPNQKFYDQEVLKTEIKIDAFTSEVVGKCLVLNEVTFKNYHAKDISEEDVYVCLNRYTVYSRKFAKLKESSMEIPEGVVLLKRETPKPTVLTQSSFSLKMEQRKNVLAELEKEVTNPTPHLATNILKPLDKDSAGNIFYVQFCFDSLVIKLGDFVYVRKGQDQTSILHVNRIFVTKQGKGFVVGLIYLRKSELPVDVEIPEDSIDSEVYFTSLQEDYPIESIARKCCVLNPKDYVAKRPTEIKEKDAFLCRRSFDSKEKSISLLTSGIFKYSLPTAAYHEEVYFFIKPDNISKFEASKVDHSDLTSLTIKRKSRTFSVEGEQSNNLSGKFDDSGSSQLRFHGQKNHEKRRSSLLEDSNKERKNSSSWDDSKRKLQENFYDSDSKKKVSRIKNSKDQHVDNWKKKCYRTSDSAVNFDVDSENVSSESTAMALRVQEILKRSKSTKNKLKYSKKPILEAKPLKPEKEIRGFIQFVLETRSAVECSHLTSTTTEIAKILAANWILCSHRQRQAYNDRSLSVIKKELNSEESYSEGYMLYSSELRKIVRISFPEAKIGLVIFMIKETWSGLRDDDKKNFQLQATLWDDSHHPSTYDFLGFSQNTETDKVSTFVENSQTYELKMDFNDSTDNIKTTFLNREKPKYESILSIGKSMGVAHCNSDTGTPSGVVINKEELIDEISKDCNKILINPNIETKENTNESSIEENGNATNEIKPKMSVILHQYDPKELFGGEAMNSVDSFEEKPVGHINIKALINESDESPKVSAVFDCTKCSSKFETEDLFESHRKTCCLEVLNSSKPLNSEDGADYVRPGPKRKKFKAFDKNDRICSLESDPQKIFCSCCSASFSSRTSHASHVRLYCSGNEFSCHICPMRFKVLECQQFHSKQHEISHSSEVHCSKCDINSDKYYFNNPSLVEVENNVNSKTHPVFSSTIEYVSNSLVNKINDVEVSSLKNSKNQLKNADSLMTDLSDDSSCNTKKVLTPNSETPASSCQSLNVRSPKMELKSSPKYESDKKNMHMDHSLIDSYSESVDNCIKAKSVVEEFQPIADHVSEHLLTNGKASGDPIKNEDIIIENSNLSLTPNDNCDKVNSSEKNIPIENRSTEQNFEIDSLRINSLEEVSKNIITNISTTPATQCPTNITLPEPNNSQSLQTDVHKIELINNDKETGTDKIELSTGSNKKETGTDKIELSTGSNDKETGTDQIELSTGSNDKENVTDGIELSSGTNKKETGTDKIELSTGSSDKETGTDQIELSTGSNDKENVTDGIELSSGSNDKETGTDKIEFSTGRNDKETVTDTLKLSTGRNEKETGTDKIELSTGSNEKETGTDKIELSTGSNDKENVTDEIELSSGSNDKETGTDTIEFSTGRNDKETVTDTLKLSTGRNEKETGTDKIELSTGSNKKETGTDKIELSTGSNDKETGTDETELSQGSNDKETGTDTLELSTGSNDIETGTDKIELSTGSNDKETGTDEIELSTGRNDKETVTNTLKLSTGRNDKETGTDKIELSTGSNEKEIGTDEIELSQGSNDKETGTDEIELGQGSNDKETGTDEIELSTGSNDKETGTDTLELINKENEIVTTESTGNDKSIVSNGSSPTPLPVQLISVKEK